MIMEDSFTQTKLTSHEFNLHFNHPSNKKPERHQVQHVPHIVRVGFGLV